MDVLYSRGHADVLEIQSGLPNPPSGMAIRRMLSILEEKGQLKRRKQGRKFIYQPAQAKAKAGFHALQHVLETFFEGAVDKALALHLARTQTCVTDEQLNRMMELIQDARNRED